MTRDRIALIGALAVALVALVGGIVLTVKGVAAPGWLTTILTIVGSAFALFVTPPKGDK